MLYKILTSKVRSEDELVGLKHNIRQTRGQSLQIAKVRTIRKVGRNYISTRSCDKWNRLPQRVTSAKIVQTFKTRLGEFLKSEWFEVPIVGFVTWGKTVYIFLLTPDEILAILTKAVKASKSPNSVTNGSHRQ